MSQRRGIPVPFVGGSNELRRKKADTQRSINLYPSYVEASSGRMFLKSIPGLRLFSSAPAPIEPNPPANARLLYNFVGDPLLDETTFHHDLTEVGADATFAGGELVLTGNGSTSYTMTPIYSTLGTSDVYTVQGYCTIPEVQPQRFPTIFVLQTTYPYTGYLMLRFSREGHIGQWEGFSTDGGDGATAYSEGTWPPGKYHFCFMRDLPGLGLWINGQKVASLGVSTLSLTGNMQLLLGTQTGAAGDDPNLGSGFLGSISSFKISYGTRLFGESFTPPAEPLLLDEDSEG